MGVLPHPYLSFYLFLKRDCVGPYPRQQEAALSSRWTGRKCGESGCGRQSLANDWRQ